MVSQSTSPTACDRATALLSPRSSGRTRVFRRPGAPSSSLTVTPNSWAAQGLPCLRPVQGSFPQFVHPLPTVLPANSVDSGRLSRTCQQHHGPLPTGERPILTTPVPTDPASQVRLLQGSGGCRVVSGEHRPTAQGGTRGWPPVGPGSPRPSGPSACGQQFSFQTQAGRLLA